MCRSRTQDRDRPCASERLSNRRRHRRNMSCCRGDRRRSEIELPQRSVRNRSRASGPSTTSRFGKPSTSSLGKKKYPLWYPSDNTTANRALRRLGFEGQPFGGGGTPESGAPAHRFRARIQGDEIVVPADFMSVLLDTEKVDEVMTIPVLRRMEDEVRRPQTMIALERAKSHARSSRSSTSCRSPRPRGSVRSFPRTRKAGPPRSVIDRSAHREDAHNARR